MIERSGDRRSQPADEPAPTLTEKARSDEWVYDTRNGGWGSENQRGGAEPAPCLTAAGLAKGRDVIRRKYVNGNRPNAVRVTIEEASILQGFSPDYPWQGSRTKQFQQIGNALPPPMAEAILRALLGEAVEFREVA